MFDRVISWSWRITTAPHVNLAAINALAMLLQQAGNSLQS